MTSSETRTDSRKKSRGKKKRGKGSKRAAHSASNKRNVDDDDVEDRPSGPDDDRPGLPPQLFQAAFALVLVGGWLAIFKINRWYLGPPVFFLCVGWLAVLLTARFAWNAGMSAAEEDDGTLEEEFWRAEGPQDELQREKRSLLKAIKEIEFDHQMGKMSDQDARELKHFYRARAIEIIKALEADGSEGELSISDKIDREVKARLTIAQASAKGKKQAKVQGQKKRGSAEAEKGQSKTAPDATTDATTDAAPEATTGDAASDADDSTAEAPADADERNEAESGEGDGGEADEGTDDSAQDDRDQPAVAIAEVGS